VLESVTFCRNLEPYNYEVEVFRSNLKMRIADTIRIERIAAEADVQSRKSALEKLALMLSSADQSLATQTIFETLFNRERLGTTGLGGGIAIPHGRVDTKLAAIGAFLRTENPLDFSATDNRPVDLFFALCVPKNGSETHLALLGELVTRLREKEFVERLRGSIGAEEIMACFSEITDAGSRKPSK
jgi:PTS system nitrogen regulatory IIA component